MHGLKVHANSYNSIWEKCASKTLVVVVAQVEGSKKAANCNATITITVKKDNKDVRYRDDYVKRGLLGIVTIDNRHSHLIDNAVSLSWLKRTESTKSKFLGYFNAGD